MEKILIIGLDLSFSSTGICVSYLEDSNAKKMEFFKILYDDCKNITGKPYEPEPIKNVTQIVYKLPTNLTVHDLCYDLKDINNVEQTETTLKAMICAKKIFQIVEQKIELYNPELVIFSIENYIMPAFQGQNQLKTVSGLITLQGYVRRDAIQICLKKNINVKLWTPTASNNKLYFAKKGDADKSEMMKCFIRDYEGKKLLPEASIEMVARMNDIIDAFSLMIYAYSKLISLKTK